MIYDKNDGKIKISCREFVAVARRGISSSLPFDEFEPEAHGLSEKTVSNLLPNAKTQTLIYKFTHGEYHFELDAPADKIDESGKISLVRRGDVSASKRRKEFTAQTRAEGFITAYVYSEIYGVKTVPLELIYTDVNTGDVTTESETVEKKKLDTFFLKCLNAVSVYATPEIERVTKRLPTMQALKFPYEKIREGQSELVRATYRNIARGGTLYAVAPTGTGKTVSVLYPAAKALGDGRCNKVFYLTPKDTTAIAAKECLELLADTGAVIRAIMIGAKEKICRRGLLCRESKNLCECAKCNNLKDAVLSLYKKELTVVTRDDVLAVASEYTVCPYELSLAYAELCDFVICDFNYLFDTQVYIRRFFSSGGNYAFLIDEAHNLPERAREMYSAEISSEDIKEPLSSSHLGVYSETRKAASDAAERFSEILYPFLSEEIREDSGGDKVGAAHLSDVPLPLFEIIGGLVKTAEDELWRNLGARDAERDARLKELRAYLYKLKKFNAAMERFDSSYEMFLFCKNGSIHAKLYCIDTGKEISERLKKGSSATFFSATLTPLYYYKSLFGGDNTADTLEVNSPFDEAQLSVNIMDKISTRFSEREDTLSAVIRVICATISAKRGNYMVFSPSFQYSDALAKIFTAKYPKMRVLVQKRNMTLKEKESFLSEFSKEDNSYLVAFCVMGGAYSEGIDLAGDKLIGAVVVGIGLPGLSYEREAIAAYYNEKYEEGKQFAYIYPGMNRVLQAAGRVIRREEDKGVIVLIDDRFDDPIYKKIVPKLWHGMRFIDDAKILKASLDEFWSEK